MLSLRAPACNPSAPPGMSLDLRESEQSSLCGLDPFGPGGSCLSSCQQAAARESLPKRICHRGASRLGGGSATLACSTGGSSPCASVSILDWEVQPACPGPAGFSWQPLQAGSNTPWPAGPLAPALPISSGQQAGAWSWQLTVTSSSPSAGCQGSSIHNGCMADVSVPVLQLQPSPARSRAAPARPSGHLPWRLPSARDYGWSLASAGLQHHPAAAVMGSQNSSFLALSKSLT